jgi:hypothetical protein
VLVRRNATGLSQFTVKAIEAGIHAMKARSDTDPTSWIYQANMHGTDDPRNLPAWSTCQHGSYLFLSWHRMYLYFFERILRKSSGLADLTLPYWNYSDPRARALPRQYWHPASETLNMLYIPQRAPGINEGAVLPEEATDYQDAFDTINFSAPEPNPPSGHFPPPVSDSFGGPVVGGPTHDGAPPGKLESLPHNAVHVLVGGRDGGYMAIVELAARDPIFWAHHANIDRLWSKWIALGGGREDPPKTDTVWRNTPFKFFDENGACVVMTGEEVMNTAQQLNYKYDDEERYAPSSRTTKAAPSTNGRSTDGQGTDGQAGGGEARLLAEAPGHGRAADRRASERAGRDQGGPEGRGRGDGADHGRAVGAGVAGARRSGLRARRVLHDVPESPGHRETALVQEPVLHRCARTVRDEGARGRGGRDHAELRSHQGGREVERQEAVEGRCDVRDVRAGRRAAPGRGGDGSGDHGQAAREPRADRLVAEVRSGAAG